MDWQEEETAIQKNAPVKKEYGDNVVVVGISLVADVIGCFRVVFIGVCGNLCENFMFELM